MLVCAGPGVYHGTSDAGDSARPTDGGGWAAAASRRTGGVAPGPDPSPVPSRQVPRRSGVGGRSRGAAPARRAGHPLPTPGPGPGPRGLMPAWAIPPTPRRPTPRWSPLPVRLARAFRRPRPPRRGPSRNSRETHPPQGVGPVPIAEIRHSTAGLAEGVEELDDIHGAIEQVAVQRFRLRAA